MKRQKLLPSGELDTCPPTPVDKCPPILEIDKDIDIEIEGREIAPAVLGRYQNVFLSEWEQAELQAEFPNLWQEYVERLSAYMASTGKKYQNHAATIRRWIADDRRKGNAVPDYSYQEDESL